MIIALVPPSVIALQVASAPAIAFAPPPQSAISGAGTVAKVAVKTPGATIGPAAPTLMAQAAPALAQTVVTRTTTTQTTTTVLGAAAAPAQASAAEAAASGDTASLAAVPVPTRPLPSPAGIAPMTLLKTTLAAASPLIASDPSIAQPADGLWVLATVGCPLPTGTDLNAWADCTQPLGFNAGELAVLEKPKAGNKAQQTGGLFSIARTRYRLGSLGAASPQSLPGTPGPALVQVEVPGLTGRSYIYVAVRPEIMDGEGRFVSARAWPVPCPAPATPGVNRRGDRCFASTLQAVKDAAAAEPVNGGYSLRWIDPTDAGSAGDTTGARVYAPPPAPVFKAPRKLTPLEAAQPLPISDLPPELAAQQPTTPVYAPREEGGDDSAPAKNTSAKATKSAKSAAKAKKKS